MPNTLPLHNSQTLKIKFTIETPKLNPNVHSCSHTCTTWALYAIFGQKISTRSDDHVMETPEGYHQPGEKHNSLGVHLQDIVNYYGHELDTIHATIGTTPHKQSRGAPLAAPSVFQLM